MRGARYAWCCWLDAHAWVGTAKWKRQVEASSGSVRARSQGERIVKSACEESKWAFLLTVKRIGARQKRSCELAKLS